MIDQVQRIYIPKGGGLDSIVLYIEEWLSKTGNCNSGSITAVCYGNAWNFVAGSIHTPSMAKFVSTCDPEYLADKFNPGLCQLITDYEAVSRSAGVSVSDSFEVGFNYNAIVDHYGPDLANALPKKENHKYQYLVKVAARIIEHLASEFNDEC